MAAAKKSIAAYPTTTETTPGPIVNGVTERQFQEALMRVLEAINNNQKIALPGKP